MTISRRGFLAAASGGVALGLSGELTGARAEDAVKRGGTLVAIVQPEPTFLTSALNSNYYYGVVSTNMFDGLLRYDASFSPQPALAEHWESAPDNLSITFHLRHDVKWHDGKPFTSADVAFGILDVLKKYSPRGRENFGSVEAIETPDPYTAVFKLSRPTPVIMSALNAHEAQILPRHLYEGTEISTNPHNIKPVGTGAFRFKEWSRGEYITLERNPDYWDKERPYLDKIIFRIIPDAGSRSAALETGEVQYAPYDPVSFSDFERLKAVPGLALSTKGYEYQSQELVIECNLRRGPTATPQVRQAIAHAIDRGKLTDTVWYGIGKPATGPIPSTTTRFYTPDIPQYPYDKAKANQLLDAAGFPNKGGARFKLSLSYMPFNETLRMSAEFVRQSLKEVGIDATIESADTAGYARRVYTQYDFDLNLGQFATFVDPDMGITRLFWSKAIKAGIPYTNASGYNNPEMDKIIEAEKRESDPQRRVELFHQYQKIAQTDLPIIPLMELQHFTVYSKKLQGLSATPDAALTSLKSVSLAT